MYQPPNKEQQLAALNSSTGSGGDAKVVTPLTPTNANDSKTAAPNTVDTAANSACDPFDAVMAAVAAGINSMAAIENGGTATGGVPAAPGDVPPSIAIIPKPVDTSNVATVSAFNVLPQVTPRYAADDYKGWSAYLEEHGYVVIKELATPTELDKAHDLLWNIFRDINTTTKGTQYPTRVERYKPGTWDRWMGLPSSGIMAGWGIGQSDVSWFIRTLPGVRKIFAQVWQCDEKELLSSFDGLGIFRPWNQYPTYKTKGGWYHVDQHPVEKAGLHCVQGFVSLTDQDAETGGLVVIPGTHKHQADVADPKYYGGKFRESGDFITIPKDHPLLKRKAIVVDCKSGDLVLWDSRTIHCNTPALTKKHRSCPKRVTAKEATAAATAETATAAVGLGGAATTKAPTTDVKDVELLRVVVYACMTPLRLCKDPDTVIPERLKCYARGDSTNHWPHECLSYRDGMTEKVWQSIKSNPLQISNPAVMELLTGGWNNGGKIDMKDPKTWVVPEPTHPTTWTIDMGGGGGGKSKPPAKQNNESAKHAARVAARTAKSKESDTSESAAAPAPAASASKAADK